MKKLDKFQEKTLRNLRRLRNNLRKDLSASLQNEIGKLSKFFSLKNLIWKAFFLWLENILKIFSYEIQGENLGKLLFFVVLYIIHVLYCTLYIKSI